MKEHVAHNAMDEPGEIARFRDRCSLLMGALLDELASTPNVARPFPAIEDALDWPHRRIASVLGGVWHLRQTEFSGRRPYRFYGDRESASGRWELFMDDVQAEAVREAATGAGGDAEVAVAVSEGAGRRDRRAIEREVARPLDRRRHDQG